MAMNWNDAGTGFHTASSPDFLPRQQLEQLQLQRLKATIRRAYDRVELFRKRLDERGVRPEHVEKLSDLARLPFTVKTDLRDTYPFGLFASPMEEIVRLHASSGTTGKPIVVAYTQPDLDVWRNTMLRTFVACGVGPADVVQNAYGYGLFTGGLGAHYGAEALGAAVIPISGGNTDRQVMIMKDFGATVICCTPSYFLHLYERAVELKMRPDKLRVGVFGAEPWSEVMRQRMQKESGIKAYDIYGLSEIIGPGVASECGCQEGLHIFEDHFLPEIIDPVTGHVLPDGTEGELVLTTLSKQAMPMIRYRTRDITSLMTETCGCGRTIRRMVRVTRRSDDMFIIRGVNVFPSQIECALLAVEGTLPHYQIVLTRQRGLDEMEVKVEVGPEFLSDRISAMEELRNKLSSALEHLLGVRALVTLVEPRTIRRSEGKASRVLDQRELK
jgi:phenylacetate-CoA ligase